MWKKYIAVSIAVSLIVLFLARDKLIDRLVTSYFDDYCLEAFGCQMQFANKEHLDHQFVFDHAVVETIENLREGGVSFSADKISVSYAFQWLRMCLDVDVRIQNPVISLKNDADIKALAERFWQERGLVPLRPRVEIQDGVFHFHNLSDAADRVESIFYSIDLNLMDEEYARLKVGFGDSTFQQNSMEVSFSRDDKTAVDFKAAFRKLDLNAISKMLFPLYPPLRSWEAECGSLDGELSARRLRGKRFESEGKAYLRELKMVNRSLGLAADIGEVRVDFSRDSETLNTTIGKLEIAKGSSLVIDHSDLPIWKIKDILGGIAIESHDGAKIDLHGVCESGGNCFDFRIRGDGRYFEDAKKFLKLDIALSNQEGGDANAFVVMKQMNDLWNSIDINLKNFGYHEFQFVQEAMSRYSDDWRNVRLHRGNFNASVILHFKELNLHHLKVKKFTAKDVLFDYYPLNLNSHVEHAKGFLSVNLGEQDVLQTLNTELSIDGGMARILEENGEAWQLSDIQTKLTFHEGVIQKSNVKGNFLGLEGDIALDWLSDDEIMKVKFQGMPRNLNAPVPELLKKGIDAKFSEDLVSLTAGFKVNNQRLYVEGLLEVEDREHKTCNDIAFGFRVEKTNPKLSSQSKKKNEDIDTEKLQQLSGEVLNLIMPDIASPALLLNNNWIEAEQGISGLILRDGWIYAESLPLEKYVAPFAFQAPEGQEEHSLIVDGVGDFRGVFDHKGLGVLYNVKDLIIENENFHFKVDTLFSTDEDDERKNALGYHYADFATGRHFGLMPVKHGTYLDKNNSLLFNEVSTNLKFEGKHIHITDLETYCCGIHFGGNININCDYTEPGRYDVEIIADTMNGKISQLQNLFMHFEKPPLFTEFPMEGDLHFRDKGAYIFCSVCPEGSTVQTRFQASLSDGFISLRPLDLSLQEFGMQIDYDQKLNRLLMNDIMGTVVVGRGNSAEEYQLSGERIAFNDLENNVSEFDLWVGDRKRDIIRIAGISKGTSETKNSAPIINFELDTHKTHFGDVYPTQFSFSLADWSKINKFQLDFNFRLSTLFKDLQRLSRSGIFFFPIDMLEEFNNLKEAYGDFNVRLFYDQNSDAFRYALKGNHIECHNYRCDIFELTGKVRDKTWSVDQLRLDDFSVAAEAMRLADRWRVNFLGLRRGESFLMGLDGDYLDKTGSFEANINLLELDLSHLNEWSQFQNFVNKNNPQGYFKAKGKLQLDRTVGSGSWFCNASLSASVSDLKLRDVSFADAADFSCQLMSDRGMTLRNITTAIRSSSDPDRQVPMHIEKIDHDLKNDELDIERIHFTVPQKYLAWFANTLQKAMPEDISDRTVEMISSLKEDGPLLTTVSYQDRGEHSLLKIALDDGMYRFAEGLHQIRNFRLSYAPGDFSAQMEYLYEQRPLLMHVLSEDPEVDYGTIILADKLPETSEAEHPQILIDWVVDPIYGFTIKEAKGAVSGLQLHLQHDRKHRFDRHYHQLKGWAALSFPEAFNLCEKDFVQSCYENKFSGNYTFNGNWSISKNSDVDSHFMGKVQGQEVIMKGYQLDRLDAILDYSTKKIVFKDLEVADTSGHIKIPALTLTYWTDKQWWFYLPELQVANFRPGALRDTEQKNQASGKTLIINKINISDIKGKLAEGISWTGKGMLKFSNPPKNSLQNTIFAIPHEIITRIGLNPAVLTPVAGSIYFDIKNGKIVFTKFKDVYSESRASKFYLPDSPVESYVDFDGNIFVQVKMKQYNLLFKLAELFTFNVKGTLEKPVYMIQKQGSSK